MSRLLTLGCLLVPAAAFAADPPLYPTNPAGSLSQSLPSLVSGSLGTAPPVMVSQPAWGGTAVGCPTPACPPTANWPTQYLAPCPAPACAARQPLLVPRVHRLPMPVAAGCGSRGSLLDRLRTWLCGGAGPAVTSGFVLAPPVVPLRDWGWTDTTVGGPGVSAAGFPSNCDARGGRLLPQFPMGLVFARTADPCPTAYPTAGPRPIHIPLATAYDRAATCARPRPNLLRRLIAFLTPGWFGCGDPCEYPVAVSVPSYGSAPGCDVPAVGGYAPAPLAAPVAAPLSGYPVAQPAPAPVPLSAAPVGNTGGYHFAAPERRPVSVMPAAAVAQPLSAPAIQPASATQPAPRQR